MRTTFWLICGVGLLLPGCPSFGDPEMYCQSNAECMPLPGVFWCDPKIHQCVKWPCPVTCIGSVLGQDFDLCQIDPSCNLPQCSCRPDSQTCLPPSKLGMDSSDDISVCVPQQGKCLGDATPCKNSLECCSGACRGLGTKICSPK